MTTPSDVPTWNTSTTVVRTLRDRMHALGWADNPTLELPLCDWAEELDQRPLDLGEGLWR